MPDVVAVIKAQHRQVEKLLEQAQEEDSDTLALLQHVSDLLLPHSQAEESFVYPAIRQHDSDQADEVHDGAAEHHHVEALLRELLGEDPDGPGYDGKLAALVGELQHHVQEEEQDLLPVLTKQASDEEREQLGQRFVAETGADDSPAAGESDSRDELYERAKQADIQGRSTMTKQELADALGES